MGLFEQFPYSNFHELNLDWILRTLKELNAKIASIEDTIFEKSKKYTDEQIKIIQQELTGIEDEFNQFTKDINAQFATFRGEQNAKFEEYKEYVNAQLALMEQEIRDAKAELTTLVQQANGYTDASIALLKMQLPDMISENVKNAKVYNLLTGAYVTIQAMFDFLCGFHAPDAITCGDAFARNNTNAQILAYNQTCQAFLANGKNIIIQR